MPKKRKSLSASDAEISSEVSPASTKKSKKTAKAVSAQSATEEADSTSASSSAASAVSSMESKHVVLVEASKECQVFTRLGWALLQQLLGDAYRVEVNRHCPNSKPRKGAFVVTFGDAVVCELLAMPRPFNKLRQLDMTTVVDAIKQRTP